MDDGDALSSLIGQQRLAERAFVACAFVLGKAAVDKYNWMEPQAFLDEEARAAWRALIAAGGDVAAAIVSSDAASKTVTWYNEAVVNAFDIDNYATSILSLSQRRGLLDMSTELVKAILEGDIQRFRQVLGRMSTAPASGAPVYKDPSHVNDEMLAHLLANGSRAVLSGIQVVDDAIGGMMPGELIVLAARPGVGKTQFTLQMAIQNAERFARHVLYFSLEMNAMQLWARHVAPVAQVPLKRVRLGVDEDDIVRLSDVGLQRVKALGARLAFVEGIYSLHGIHSACVSAPVKPDLIIIDQLSEIERPYRASVASEGADSVSADVGWYGYVCRYIRHNIAAPLACPVVVVHQLNRASEARRDHRPLLSDLRSSGMIEQLADMVLLLHREDVFDRSRLMRAPDGVVARAELIVAKNRNGPAGSVIELNYNLSRQWYYAPLSGERLHRSDGGQLLASEAGLEQDQDEEGRNGS